MQGALMRRFLLVAFVWFIALQVSIDRGWYPEQWRQPIWLMLLVGCAVFGAWAIGSSAPPRTAIALQLGACYLGTVANRAWWAAMTPSDATGLQVLRFVVAGISLPLSSPHFWRYLAVFWAPVAVATAIALATGFAGNRRLRACA